MPGAGAQARENHANAQGTSTQAPSGTDVCPEGRIRQGVFFDGTGNNMYRDWAPTEKERKTGKISKEDGDGGPTNVAKLFQLFIVIGGLQEKAYHIGPGGGKESSKQHPSGFKQRVQSMWENYGPPQWFGGGAGAGSSGREYWGLDVLTTFFNKNQNQLAKEKRVDVFGFSRGSAIARDFIKMVKTTGIDNYKQPDGYRYIPMGEGPPVEVPAYKRTKPIFFEFLGVFDTVASMGLGAAAGWGNSLAGYDFYVNGRPADKKKTPDDVLKAEPLEPKEEWVHRTFHAIAEDEYRDVFPVELLGLDPKDKKYKRLPKYLRERPYPGAHSDVGGGYGYTSFKAGKPAKTYTRHDEFGVPYEWTDPGTPDEPAKGPELAFIPLADMWDEAKKAGVPLNPLSSLAGNLWKVPGPVKSAYDNYVTLRTRLFQALIKPPLPLFADYIPSVQTDPVYLQAIPEKEFQAIQRLRTRNADYQTLFQGYIHEPHKEGKWKVFDGIKTAVRPDTWGSSQRGVAYMTAQHSYDPESSTLR